MICENCGKPLEVVEDIVFSFVNGDSIHAFCKQCSSQFGTCAMCANISCGFFNDPDPMPQFIVIARQMQQGNATFIEQKQIPNSDRIKKFCIDGKCKCFLDDSEHPLCCRHGGYTTCTNYCEKEKHNFVQDFPMTKANEN
jgi:hypothetical protein